MAKLIHGSTLAGIKKAGSLYSSSTYTDAAKKSLIFTDDGYIVTKGHEYFIPAKLSNVQAGTESSSNSTVSVPQLTIDEYGRITAYTICKATLNQVISADLINNGKVYLLGKAEAIGTSGTVTKDTVYVSTDANGIATLHAPNFSGTYSGDAVDVAHGGTGNTTFTANSILVGNGSANIKTVLNSGNSAVLTQSNSTTPTWTAISNTVTNDSSSLITSGAVYTAIQNGFAANDAMIFKGVVTATSTGSIIGDASTDSAGYTWKASNAGYLYYNTDGNLAFYTITQTNLTSVGVLEPGDMIVCNTNATTVNSVITKATYSVIQTNIDGAVTATDTLTENQVVIGQGTKAVKTVALGRGINLANSVIGHSNSVPKQETQGIYSIKYDDYGHITAGTKQTTYNLLIQSNGTLKDTYNPLTTSGANKTLDFNSEFTLTTLTNKTTIALAKQSNISSALDSNLYKIAINTKGIVTKADKWDLNTVTFDAVKSSTYNGTTLTTNPIYNPDGTGVTIKANRGVVLYGSASDITIGHSNNITELTTATPKKITYDSYGHITSSSDISALTIFGQSYTGVNPLEIKYGGSLEFNTTTKTLTSTNTWRDICLNVIASGAKSVASTSIGTNTLVFGDSFGAATDDGNIDLMWAEVDSSGNISYSI